MQIGNIQRALPRSGLHLAPADRAAAGRAIVASIAGVTLFIVALDLVCRERLDRDYVALFTAPLMPRMAVMSGLALAEEVIYRLGVMAVLAFALSRGTGKLPAWGWAAVIVTAQFVNVGALVMADPLYATLRYLAVGSVWGWLTWRHGWLSGAIGHVGCHLVLDPALFLVLA